MSEELTVLEPEVMLDEANVYEDNGIVLYDDYDELVERVKARMTQEVEGVVWTRWTLGAHVKAVLEEAVYGSHKIDDLEKDIGISKKTLYACKTLFETFTRDEMESKVIPRNIPFRSLNYLTRVEDPDKRDAYLEQIADGEIKAEDIPKLETETAPAGDGGEGGDADGATGAAQSSGESKSDEAKAAARVRKAMGAADAPIDLLLPALPELDKTLPDMDVVAGDDELYERVLGELSVFAERVEELEGEAKKLVASLKKIV